MSPQQTIKPVAVAGAGLSGAVVARELAEAGLTTQVFESRSYVAGNCYTERDSTTGIQVHRHGPHIFHTKNKKVWQYVNNFAEFLPYRHRVIATAAGQTYSMPINLLTLNQLFGCSLNPNEAADLISENCIVFEGEPQNFKEAALAMVGKKLYETFFKGYSIKQWGLQPEQIPAAIFKRLPIRFNYDDTYFNHPFQGIPRDGYTALVENILDHPLITVNLNCKYEPAFNTDFCHLFYSGSIDAYYNFEYGQLPYRTLDFEVIRAEGEYQGTAVMNYCDEEIPYTRITEHKQFAPWEQHTKTICYKEFSRIADPDDILYYPVHLANGDERLTFYRECAEQTEFVTFVGRLGRFKYMDMDVAIAEALSATSHYIQQTIL